MKNVVPQGLGAINWRLIGFGFYWAWTSIAFFSPVLGSLAPQSEQDQTSWLIFAITALLVHALVLIFRKYLTSFIAYDIIFWLTPFVSAAGIVLIAFGSTIISSEQISGSLFFVLGSIMTGVGSSITVLMWGEVYAGLSFRSSLFYTSASFVLLAVVHFIVVYLFAALGIFITALLPVFSALCMRNAKRTSAKNAVAPKQRKVALKPTLILPLIAIVALGSCCELLHALAANPSTATTTSAMGTLYTLGGLIGTALMACVVGLIKKERRQSIYFLVRTILVCMALGLLVSTLFSLSFTLTYAIFGAAFWCFRTIVWSFGSRITQELKVSPLVVFAAIMCAFDVAIVLGIFYGASVTQAILDASLNWTIVALVAIVCILLVAMFLFSEKNTNELWGLAGQLPEQPKQELPHTTVFEECGLTSREVEICLLLCEGRSMPYVQKELHIAKGTANTHVRHIYEKLQVHTRQELLDKLKTSAPIEQ